MAGCVSIKAKKLFAMRQMLVAKRRSGSGTTDWPRPRDVRFSPDCVAKVAST
jgi:hypothetical protein